MPAVTVHRCILAARSGFFRALLEGPMGDAGHTELTLKVLISALEDIDSLNHYRVKEEMR